MAIARATDARQWPSGHRDRSANAVRAGRGRGVGHGGGCGRQQPSAHWLAPGWTAPCEGNTKGPRFDRNDTPRRSDKGLVCALREKTPEVTVASSMYWSSAGPLISDPKGQGPGKVGGRAATTTPKAPSPSHESLRTPDLHGPPDNGTAKFHSPKSCGNKAADSGPARCVYRG